jgi:hypothetical protein
MRIRSLGLNKWNEACVIYQALPLAHLLAIICYLITPAVLDCGLILQSHPLDWALQPRHKIGMKPVINIVPAQLKMIEQSWWLNRESLIAVGTDKSPKPTLDKISAVCPDLHVTYGLTEAGVSVSAGRWSGDQPEGWIGDIFPEIQFRFQSAPERETKTLQIRSPSLALTAHLTDDGFLDTQDAMNPWGRGAVYIGRLGDRFKWRGRLYSSDLMRETVQRIGITQKATLCILEDLKLALITENQLEPRWDEVFSQLKLPFPEHFLLAAGKAGKIHEPTSIPKIDIVDFINKNGFPMDLTKIIYF